MKSGLPKRETKSRAGLSLPVPLALCVLLAVGVPTAPSQESGRGATSAKPRARYLGRPIARTMHWSGAGWLLRSTREDEENASAMLAALEVRPGSTVCDLGCGVGYHALRLAKLVEPGGKVYAVDIQPEMLRRLEVRAHEAGIDNITSVLGKAAELELPESSCDLILLVDVYHEISYPEKMLRSLRRVLKPEGRVAFVEFRAEDPEVPIKTVHKMSKRQLLREVIPQGFRLVAEVDDLPWQHLMIFQRARLAPLRMLFVGNSYTQANDLPAVVRQLGQSDDPALEIEVGRRLRGGYDLERHWDEGKAASEIREGRWDFVVLQEQSLRPLSEPDSMREHARKLNTAIERAGSRSLLFMTWARKNRPEMTAGLAEAYRGLGDELGSLVAPVGVAWAEALRQRPGLSLHAEDGSHPAPAGTYLAACVIYATLTARAPPGGAGAPPLGLDELEASLLRSVAWDIVNQEPDYITATGRESR